MPMGSNTPVRPAVLCVLDGFGLSYRKKANAIAQARTPFLDELMATYPMTTLGSCGEDVGLAEGQMGDSNVGHLNLGAGRVVYQDLVRINRSIRSGDFFKIPALAETLARAARPGVTLHLMGLCSDGGVHSHLGHLVALLRAAREAGVSRAAVHAFLDGRDVPPSSAGPYLEAIESASREIGLGKIATVSGRYYAMDRDNRWDRVELAYRALAQGEGLKAASAAEALQNAYGRAETDEFVKPSVVVGSDGTPEAVIADGDVVIFFNYRADRAREITRALTQKEGFDRFGRDRVPDVFFLGMTSYDETFNLPHLFAPQLLVGTLGEVVASGGLRQYRVAETEKYAHVTFFFNGGEEKVFPGEQRLLVPSPKVATYDLAPEMSARPVTDAAVGAILSGEYSLVVMNYANPDMVGHTGVFEAAVKAVETVDECIGRVALAARESGAALVIIADHGNADQMENYRTGEPHTNHTLNPVPFVLVDDHRLDVRLRPGVLADVAPTVLELMGLPKPAAMTNESLLKG